MKKAETEPKASNAVSNVSWFISKILASLGLRFLIDMSKQTNMIADTVSDISTEVQALNLTVSSGHKALRDLERRMSGKVNRKRATRRGKK